MNKLYLIYLIHSSLRDSSFYLSSACPFSSSSFLQGFPCGSAGKESACNAGDLGSIPGLGRSPGEGKGYPLQDSGLENSVHGVRKNWTRLSNFHFSLSFLNFHFSLSFLQGESLDSTHDDFQSP